jgi:hypothetical protein
VRERRILFECSRRLQLIEGGELPYCKRKVLTQVQNVRKPHNNQQSRPDCLARGHPTLYLTAQKSNHRGMASHRLPLVHSNMYREIKTALFGSGLVSRDTDLASQILSISSSNSRSKIRRSIHSCRKRPQNKMLTRHIAISSNNIGLFQGLFYAAGCIL